MLDYIYSFFVGNDGEDGTAMIEYAILIAVAIFLLAAISGMNDRTADRVDSIASDIDAVSLTEFTIS